jgi:hypothetical protein
MTAPGHADAIRSDPLIRDIVIAAQIGIAVPKLREAPHLVTVAMVAASQALDKLEQVENERRLSTLARSRRRPFGRRNDRVHKRGPKMLVSS